MQLAMLLPSTENFSGPGGALGPVCVCRCVRAITIERNTRYILIFDIWHADFKSEGQGQ